MKKLLTLCLLCAASASLAAPVTSPLKGQIKDWPAGKTGELRLTVRPGQFGWDNAPVVGKATVDEKGQFTLNLPDAAALAKVLPEASETVSLREPCTDSHLGCARALVAAPATRWNVFELMAFEGETALGKVFYRNTVQRFFAKDWTEGTLVYSSADSKITGEYFTGGDSGGQFTWQAPLSAGWNWVSARSDVLNKDTGLWPVTVTADKLPETAFMYLTEGYGGVGMSLEDGAQGITVRSVMAGGAAEQAGVQVGDTIVAIDGRNVQNIAAQGTGTMVRGEPGTTVTLTIKRAGTTLEIKVVRRFIPVRQ
ncbi:PDZ domain-containing protein [Deinococcus fonticola]|uniref:PDZ domain-containing protein n=1 Tax=Deinococcus fonticola TaxID=2528713 RepID=UPI001074B9EA|nr:PDZ domain-containing protein [Deinococcus fonticola]